MVRKARRRDHYSLGPSPAPALTSCVTGGQAAQLYEPWVPPQSDGASHPASLLSRWGLNDIGHGKYPAHTCSGSVAIAFSPFQCHCLYLMPGAPKIKCFVQLEISSPSPCTCSLWPVLSTATPVGWTHLPALQGSAVLACSTSQNSLKLSALPSGCP